MINRRTLLALAAAATAGTLLAAPGAFAAEKWRHAIVQAKGDAAFFYMAEKKGFFAKRGLDVEFVELKGSKDVIRALLAGEVDSSDSIPADVLPAWEKGAKMRLIGSTILGYPYALYVRPEIKDWKELADKRFGVSGPGSAPHMFALAMLETAGVPTDGISIANSGGTTSRIKALSAGKLDATAASTEYIPDADKFGIKVLGEASEMAPMFPRFYITASERTIQERGDAAVQFLAGYMEGLRYAVDHRDEAIALSAEINKASPSEPRFAYAFDEIVNKKMVSLNMEIPTDKVVWMQNMMLKVGKLEKPVEVNDYIDTSLRDKALKLVGKR